MCGEGGKDWEERERPIDLGADNPTYYTNAEVEKFTWIFLPMFIYILFFSNFLFYLVHHGQIRFYFY